MKVVSKSIDVVCSFKCNGEITIYRFRLEDEYGEQQIIKIKRQVNCETLKIAGKTFRVYSCQIILNNNLRMCEIRYDLQEMKFVLFKI